MKRKRNPSEAYRAGMADLRAAAARHGTVNLTPSIAQREEWRHAWGDYMKGWNAEKRAKNPGAFAKCVKSVSARGGASDPRAVCAAAGRKKYGQAEMTRRSVAGKKRKARRGNPADAAAAAFEEFHGRESEQVVTVKQTIHYHEHLAAIGRLEALKGVTAEGGKFVLSDFKGALLCMNEKKNQLFIRGGNQKVDPSEFGAEAEHELYELGGCRVVEYFTRKDHLGKEGGTAIYVHKFERPYPTILYDAPNEQLLFAGGGYSMPPEGIDN